ncbi:hypothetical protein ACFLSJ_04440, partial [Verrucomicrobiota bacterium]
MRSFVGLVVATLFVVGCGRSGKEPDIEALLSRADALVEKGEIVKAADLLRKAREGGRYVPDRSRLFVRELKVLLEGGAEGEARERYGAEVGRDDELARGGFRVLGRHYSSQGDSEALEAWIEGILDLPLPVDLAEIAYGEHLRACLSAGRGDEVLARVPACVTRFDPEACQRVLGVFKGHVFGAGDRDLARRFVEAVKAASTDLPSLSRTAAIWRIELNLMEERWGPAEEEFGRLAGELDDRELRLVLTRMLSYARAGRQWDVLDRTCRLVMTDFP